MNILVYCPLSGANIATSLGTADYSYYFVMRHFLPLLREFGDVVELTEPPDDSLVDRYLQQGECVYFAFTPPDQAVGVTRCPVVPVFAWEYSTIPDEAFRRPRDNWVEDLRATGSAITHSGFAAGVVRAQLGESYPIASIPAPLWEGCGALRQQRGGSPPLGLDGLSLACKVIDSNDYEISNTSVRPKSGRAGARARSLAAPWDGAPLDYVFTRGERGPTLVGFNDAETWGVWSRSGHPWLMLDQTIDGEVEIELTVRGYAHNVDEPLGVELGGATAYLLLTETLATHVLRLDVGSGANFLAFHGVTRRAIGMPDPRDIGFGLARMTLRRASPLAESCLPLELDFTREGLDLCGFNPPEPVGTWTAAERCTVYLERPIAGDLHIRIELFHLLHNDGREIEVSIGNVRCNITLHGDCGVYEVDLPGVGASSYLRLDGVGAGPTGSDDDARQLGLGIARIVVTRMPEGEPGAEREPPAGDSQPPQRRVPVLYTTILNPNDGRKNWEDIITAFVYALRDRPGATLLVKIANEDLDMFFEDIFTFYMRLHPFTCRLVFIHGYLSDAEYRQLIVHSHYVVNASRGEGQCLPLMEFMSSGVPAIAPRNTAMLEYVDTSNAFIVETSPELAYWPHDPRQVYRTCWHRINWQTLLDAFADSEKLIRRSPRAYRGMSAAAVARLEDFCSLRTARGRLQAVFDGLRQRV